MTTWPHPFLNIHTSSCSDISSRPLIFAGLCICAPARLPGKFEIVLYWPLPFFIHSHLAQTWLQPPVHYWTHSFNGLLSTFLTSGTTPCLTIRAANPAGAHLLQTMRLVSKLKRSWSVRPFRASCHLSKPKDRRHSQTLYRVAFACHVGADHFRSGEFILMVVRALSKCVSRNPGLQIKAGVDFEIVNNESDPRFKEYWSEYYQIGETS